MTQQPQDPKQKPDWMSAQEWEDHLEELKAFEKRNYKHSGGRAHTSRSPASPSERK